EQEREELRTAMGAGGTGKATAGAKRAADAAVKRLEKQQKSRATRTQRDTLDLALIDLAGFYRDVLITATGSAATLTHPDHAGDITTAARRWSAESTLRRLEAVLHCRSSLSWNVKPRIAVESMLSRLYRGERVARGGQRVAPGPVDTPGATRCLRGLTRGGGVRVSARNGRCCGGSGVRTPSPHRPATSRFRSRISARTRRQR